MQTKHIIDCDSDPLIPRKGWVIESHKKGGQLEWDPSKVELYLSKHQRNIKRDWTMYRGELAPIGLEVLGGPTIKGHELRKELEKLPALNANVLDWLAKHPEEVDKIPGMDKTKALVFWGTIYRDPDPKFGGLYVRTISWGPVGRWFFFEAQLQWDFNIQNPAAVLAS